MLKVQHNDANEYQRRPTRFSSSFEPPSSAQAPTSSHQDLLRSKLNKFSTITRIPQAPPKLQASSSSSILRPPVERRSTSNVSNNSNNHPTPEPAKRPSLASSRAQPPRVRPTSLALGNGREISSSASKLATAGSRVLQRIATRATRTSSKNSEKSLESSQDNKLKVCGEGTSDEDDRTNSKSPATTRGCRLVASSRQVQRRRQDAIDGGGSRNKQQANSSSSLQSSESRLGRLKNLVAVVHPQHSQQQKQQQQRVNSTNPSTRLNKLTIMKSTTTTTKGGKVGSSSYHNRDVPNNESSASTHSTEHDRGRTKSESEHESKQDGGRHSGVKTAARPTTACTTLQATTNNSNPATTSNSNNNSTVASRQMTSSSPPHYSSCCSSSSSSTSPPSSSSCPTSEEEDKSDQFTSNNSNNNDNDNNPTKYLLSVASENNGDLDDKDKNGQHGNNKQSNKHLLARTAYPSAIAAKASTTTSRLDQQNIFCEANNVRRPPANDNNNNNCYNSNNNHGGAKSTNLTKTQASTPTISVKRNTAKASSKTTAAINNDHLLPKPMGQQVLSLMMLDVGLMPANGGGGLSSDHHHLFQQQQQQTLSPKLRRSHVRVQSPTRDDITGYTSSTCIGNNVSSHYLDHGRSFINHHERDLAKRMSTHSIDCLEHGPNEDFQSLHQPSAAAAQEMTRLQVRLSYQDNENLRSISLPSSPRIQLRAANNNNHQYQTHNDKSSIGKAPGFSRPGPDDASRHTTYQLNQKRGMVQSSNEITSLRNSCFNVQPRWRQAKNLNEHLFSICDNQDSNSLASSCSSLNHFPPLLALSNQLDVLKFEELMSKANFNTANVEQKQQRQARYSCEKNTRSPSSNCQNSANFTTTTFSSQSSDDQVLQEQFDGQHKREQSFEGVSCNHEIEKHKNHSNKEINHAMECSQQSEDSKISNPEGNQFEQPAIENADHTSNQTHYHYHNYCTDSQVQSDESCNSEQLSRRQQQRSHSISGQEFHSNGGYHRLKQSLYNSQQQQQQQHHQNNHQQQQGLFDGYQNYSAQLVAGSGRLQQVPSPSPYQQHQLAGRSPSPLSINCPPQYGSPFREAKQYPLDPTVGGGGGGIRLPRNQLHASLECLNSAYPDYHQIQRLQEQQQQQQQQLLHHQQQLHNQHYAASYVLASPPVNTVINSNGDQDLAAAAMGTPPSQCHPTASNNSVSQHLNITSPYSHQTQNLINRAMAQVSQSPMRRLGLSNPQGGASPGGQLSHISSHHQPMRAGHSSLSLASSSFIIEDKLQNEIRKLQSELKSEKEKNEALNSQLNINSSLMAAFEQSLTTLNTRLRQLTTLNEKKDNEIEDLKEQLRSSKMLDLNRDKVSSPRDEIQQTDDDNEDWAASSEIHDNNSERSMMVKTIEDLKRQLIEKDRLLTDTRLEALSAAHQLEQLESKMNGEHSILVNEDELDEGVMVVNHSPSDSDQITDSAHFSEINSQISKSNHHTSNGDAVSFNNNGSNNTNGSNLLGGSTEHNINDDHHSNHSSSDYQNYDAKESDQQPQQTLPSSISQQFHETDSGVACKLMDSLLLTN